MLKRKHLGVGNISNRGHEHTFPALNHYGKLLIRGVAEVELQVRLEVKETKEGL
jgi:hypothetical protein